MSERNFELLKKGASAALENIQARYRRLIFWLGKQILDDDFVVENIVQDTFLKLWEFRETIESPLHILFFLKFVMKRSCYSHYSKPRHKFFRTSVRSFESYENYQGYLAGYDPVDAVQNLKDHESLQKMFDLVNNALPLITPERRHLIGLCLKYGFQYKVIGRVMGMSTTETVNEVKRAIEDIKRIVNRKDSVENKNKKTDCNDKVEELSQRQLQVLKLRCEMNCSFAAIAQEFNLSQKEVHEEFMTAYKFRQQNKMQPL